MSVMAASIAASRGAQRGMGSGSSLGMGSGRSRTSRGGRDTGTEPSAPALVTMGAISIGLVCGGIWYLLSSAEGSRELKEAEYSQSVHRWEHTRRDFVGLKITASTAYHSVVLKADTSPDQLHDSENSVQLPNYEPLTYLVKGVPSGFVPETDFGSLTAVQKSDSTFRGAPHAGTLGQEWGPSIFLALKFEDSSGFGGGILETQAYPILRALIRHAPTPAPELKCQRELQGRYKAGKCWVYSKLVGICVQVHKDPTSKRWSFRPSAPGQNGTYGCDFKFGEWVAPRYERVPGPKAHGLVGFDNLTIQVRSSDDPYLLAVNLTDGQLDFGMTSQDDRAVGLVMLALGLIIACPPCFTMYKSYRRDSSSARELNYRTQDDDGDEMFGIGGDTRFYSGFESDPSERRR